MKYVEIAVPLGVRRTFAYSVPPQLHDRAVAGARVLVPFGRKILTGFVVATLQDRPKGDFRVRPIRDVIDGSPIIPPSLVQTAAWIAEHYFTPLGDVLRAAIPAGTQISGSQKLSLSPRAEKLLAGGLRPASLGRQEESILDILSREGAMTTREISDRTGVRDISRWIQALAADGWIVAEEVLQRPRVTAKAQLGIRALTPNEQALESLTAAQRSLYFMLEAEGKARPLHALLRSVKSSASVARSLAKRGLVEIGPMLLDRVPLDLTECSGPEGHSLTIEQQTIFEELRATLATPEPRRFLLHGVTGSGKTEIYLRLIGEALNQGHTAIFLVPEIGLTPLLARIAVSHFPDRVGLMHSGMSPGERFDQWNRIRSGKARVVVGTRSAVFAPLDRPRLIILDEEHDASYKQDEAPFYHAREVAWHRIQQSSGVLVLGSATPSLESFHAARDKGELGYFCLPQRFEARPLPEVTIVDMSLEFQRHGKKTVVSELLRAGLDNRLRRGEQAIVMLNRRGYSTALICRSCGHTFTCSNCSVPMTYHQKEGRIICHYCGIEQEPPSACSNCMGEYIYFVGVGSEQLEEILRSLFPTARIARVDRDTTRRRGSLRSILLGFQERKLDILIGTQILAKGHDFPNVTLVGVVAADTGLSFPDFRSAERTFQLLTQVAGRSGRGGTPGEVVIQSFYPDHYALRFARKQDYTGFFEHEIEYRKLMGYPPFTDLIQIVIADADPIKALKLAEKVARAIKGKNQQPEFSCPLRVLGPAVAPIEKLRGKYRYQLLLKSPPGTSLVPVLQAAFADLAAHRVPVRRLHVDVDPLSLL